MNQLHKEPEQCPMPNRFSWLCTDATFKHRPSGFASLCLWRKNVSNTPPHISTGPSLRQLKIYFLFFYRSLTSWRRLWRTLKALSIIKTQKLENCAALPHISTLSLSTLCLFLVLLKYLHAWAQDMVQTNILRHWDKLEIQTAPC